MRTYDNPILEALPKHLQRYVVDQNYDRYSAMDQAIWRYVMRQNYAYLKDYAFYPYIPGLTKAGLTIERIPDLQEMNDSLKRIGWGAVTVDGFIPPAAFMEFQANCVLVIAADIRQMEHIEYTPAPDIIHESSGHAPIIGEPEYAAYLQYFGEVGSKAMSSGKDFQLYEAIRHLSIVKEREDATQEEIDSATKAFEEIANNMGEPSEMALLSRLHWWTVEYGLIGSVEDHKIYGAGLLSSIGESVSCMQPEVTKLPYSLETITYSYDITKPQPQLFVTPDFQHAYAVLEEFADGMAFRTGGIAGLRKAIDSGQVSTVQLSSGLQVSGVFEHFISDTEAVAIKTTGPTALAFEGKEIKGQGKKHHPDGFSSPLGELLGQKKSLEDCTDTDLQAMGLEIGKFCTLYFKSGILVSGQLDAMVREGDKLLILTFSDCTVVHEPSNKTLFQPEWGVFDMAVGDTISSVFAGAADKFAFDPEVSVSSTKTEKIIRTQAQLDLFSIYGQIREMRRSEVKTETLDELVQQVINHHPEDWLALVELYELAVFNGDTANTKRIKDSLMKKAEQKPDLHKLIVDGLRIAETQPINLELVK